MDCWGYRASQFAPPLLASVAMGRDGQLKQLAFPQAVRTTIHIDSRDRDYDRYPSSSEFSLELPETLRNISSAVLVTAEIPLTYYVFSAARGNSSIRVGLDGVFEAVTIPDGNYTASAMESALKAALDAAFAPATFTVSFDPVTMKCALGCAGKTVAVDATAAAKPTDWGLAYYLGFPRGVVTSGADSVTGTAVAAMNPENYLLLDVEELNGISQSAMYERGGSGRKTFAKVPINGDSYQYNYYDKTLTYVDVRPQLTKLDKLRLSLRFHDGTPVDLNGAEWSVSIEFACTLTRGL